MTPNVGYRSDIDGLRAVAVLAVVLYHAGIPGFGGGFVGVDVFFVISGFLITRIVVDHLDSDDFSIVSFYERRVRRILPAFFAMLLFCSALVPFVFLPEDRRVFSASAAASVLFVSNMLFARTQAYFTDVPHYNPLLHTWSLSVEEQFYIVFPIVLILCAKFTRSRLRLVVALLALASFALGVWATAALPKIAFYVAPTRAWELLLGSLIALGAFPPLRREAWRELSCLLGLALVAGSILLLSSGGDFPGVNALFPAVGAALIIHGGAGGRSLVGRVLSLRWLVLIGLVSYSLYLWHWPLFVLADYVVIRPLTGIETAGVIAASFLAAFASWRLVEQPFRRPQPGLRRIGPFAAAGGVAAAFLVVSLAQSLAPFVDRGRDVAGRPADSLANPDRDACIGGVGSGQARTARDVDARALCRLGAADAPPPSFVLWGDSHAEAIRAGVDAAARAHGVSGYFAGSLGCPPTLGVRPYYNGREYGDCVGMNEAVLRLAHDPQITTVILHARWAFFFYGSRTAGELGPNVQLAAAGAVRINREILSAGLAAAVARLTELGKKVVIVAGVPEIGTHVPSFIARVKYFRRDLSISVTRKDYNLRNWEFNELLERISAKYSAKIVYPDDLFCGADVCKVVQDDKLLYLDDDHLSPAGARLVAPMFEPIFMESRGPIGRSARAGW